MRSILRCAITTLRQGGDHVSQREADGRADADVGEEASLAEVVDRRAADPEAVRGILGADQRGSAFGDGAKARSEGKAWQQGGSKILGVSRTQRDVRRLALRSKSMICDGVGLRSTLHERRGVGLRSR